MKILTYLPSKLLEKSPVVLSFTFDCEILQLWNISVSKGDNFGNTKEPTQRHYDMFSVL